VGNALIKQRGDKRLYLTAGFLSWPDPDNTDNLCRSPLLFYPAILVRKVNSNAHADSSGDNHTPDDVRGLAALDVDAGQTMQYEIRMESDAPDNNCALVELCARQWDIVLPSFHSSTPLQDYFTQVAAAVANCQELELEFDVAIGAAKSPVSLATTQQAVRLPDLPPNFDASLAMTITGNKNLRELHAVLNLIGDYDNAEIADHDQTAANDAGASISQLHEYSKKLAAHGLDHVEFQRLSNLPDNMQRWIEVAQQSLHCELVNSVLQQPQISARHVIRLAGAIELIDKAPLGIEQYRHPDLCYRATAGLLRRARHQSRLIEDELAALQGYFVLDKVPAKQQLLSLMEELGGTVNNEPDVVDSDYFNARRQFMEFSIEKPTTLTNEHRRLLSQLAKVLRFRELFVNNTEYRLALGPGYRGLRTDWNALEQMGEYAREFSEVLESETLAAQAMQDWERFRGTFIQELDMLQQAADAIRKLLRLVGPAWQTRSTESLVDEATDAMNRLRTWHSNYGSVSNHATHTPASVLAQFTGKSPDDVRTEIHVDETQARIDEQLSLGETARESVVDTLSWLRKASETATNHQLEIDAIVDRLQIA